ncbi:sugar ABC transporter ATP-binding protein [Chelativorans salis]|uniref:Sugar ABC transporter ATP-binding protein n=1 Tax=Chelativorans salis TaxID=2978478 RepID=A0ABT2LVX9_9HYPH|nr:sugar ABC transporter ATP-binding protein [Chelativorans sp. EGI FJ00035]MCT7378669.1 sugar ABC transporter ATP-binding protein [Chelativorans sp. EGI FJ00035]
MPNNDIMQLDNVSKRFGSVQALSNVSLTLRAGEVLALVGENGAGKSTLTRIIEGVFPPDGGGLVLDGQPVTFSGPRDGHAAGVRVIHQEPEIIPHVSVAENIYPGALPHRGGVFLDRKTLYARAGEMLKLFGMERELAPQQHCAGLGPAQRQMIEVMRAVHAGGRIIAFDEPTSSLTGEESQRLFEVIYRLRDEGVSIIYISHRLREIVDVADRIAVLRDGRLIDVEPAAEASEESITRKMVGRDLTEMFPERTPPTERCVLSVRGMSTEHVSDISFELHAGEVLGIGGLVGAGRSELAKGVFGFHVRSAGTVEVDGKAIPSGRPGDAILAGLGFAPEDRKEEALLLLRSILDNATLCIPDRVSRFGLFDRRKATDIVDGIAGRLSIKAPSLNTPVSHLSGGNQQKVVLARWLARAPKALILDEPTRGIDVGTKSEIYRLIADLARNGLGVIVISSEMPELLGMSDRILVMAGGRITAELKGDEMSENAILKAAMSAEHGAESPDEEVRTA